MAKHPETGNEIIDNLPDMSDHEAAILAEQRRIGVCHCPPDCQGCTPHDPCPC